MNLTQLYLLGGAVTVGVLLLFFVLRGLGGLLRRWFFPPKHKEPSVMDQLPAHLAALTPPQTTAERLDRSFERMVGRSALNLTVAQAVAWLLIAAILAGGGLYLWREQKTLAVAGALAATGLTLIFFSILHRVWLHQVQEQLPDLFYLLARSLRAGLTLEQSLSLIAVQGQKPLADEFRRCSEHLELGLTMPAALQMTAERINLDDFTLFASLLTIHRQTGGNLALLMDRVAATVRARNQFRGHILAVTAMGRLSGLFLSVAAPLLMVVYWFLYPDYIMRLTEGPQGLSALLTAICLEVIGVVWLLMILRIDH